MVMRLWLFSRQIQTLAVLLLLALLQCPLAAAQESLDVQADRDTMHEGQTLTLTVTGEMPISVDLDMLFNLRDLQLPSPEVAPLEKDFEILADHQKYSMRSVNGETLAIVTWTYELGPKRTGTLTIPPLTFQDSVSQPMQVEVKPGQAPQASSTADPAFVEVSADKSEVYVQEQVIITVSLFYRGNLIRGDLTQPEPGDALLETMGEQKEYTRVRDNVRYRVVERRYVAYPQSPGTLEISGIEFKGQARGADNQIRFLRDRADTLRVPVKDVPDSFTGDTWLPASSLELTQTWSDTDNNLETGQSVNRSIQLNALGLLGSALPPLKIDYPDDKLRSYPDQPDVESTVNDRTVTSTRTQSASLVAVKPGTVQLNEIRIPWWDTVNDRQREAVIPAQALNITGDDSTAAQTAAAAPDDSSRNNPPPRPNEGGANTAAPVDPGSGIWFWVALALGLGWLISALIWWRKPRRLPATASKPATTDTRENALFLELTSYAASGDAATLDLLPRWARTRFQHLDLHSVSDVVSFSKDPQLSAAIDDLQQRLYANHGATGDWSGENLVERLNALRNQSRPESGTGLNPLYPEALGARRNPA